MFRLGSGTLPERPLSRLSPGLHQLRGGLLEQALDAVGAGPYKSVGVMVVSRGRVLEALAERGTEEPEDGG